jgi:hypothetical protein
MRKLLLLPIAALIFAAGAVAPSEAAKVAPVPGFGVEDACACGGQITYRFYARYERGAYDECWYEGRAPNGTVVNYIVNTVPSSQGC